jgi:hypothetical protein
MSRQPSAPEATVLTAIAAEVSRLAGLATAPALTALGVLGPGAAPADYATMHSRFAAIGPRLTYLIANRRIFVEPVMGAGESAAASSPDEGEPFINLPPATLAPAPPATYTERALVLLHELTHTLEVPAVGAAAVDPAQRFQVKDFGYRKNWAFPYLSIRAHLDNADTYATAARLLDAGGALPPANPDRDALTAQMPAVARAMAWADFALNRAWLRSRTYAVQLAASAQWSGTNVALAANGDNQVHQSRIEDTLRAWRLIGVRDGYVRQDLSTESQAVATRIPLYYLDLKQALDQVRVRLVPAGPLAYSGVTTELLVPRSVADRPPAVLGIDILRVIAAQVPVAGVQPRPKGSPLTPDTAIDLVDILLANDAPVERPTVQALQTVFSPPGVLPALAVWTTAAATLDHHYLTRRLAGLAATVPHPGMTAAQVQQLQTGLTATVDQFTRLVVPTPAVAPMRPTVINAEIEVNRIAGLMPDPASSAAVTAQGARLHALL